MAAPVKLTDETLTNSPFLIKKYTFTAGNTATAFDHGGPGTPSFLLTVNSSANPTATEAAVYSEGATQFTLDCEAGSGTITVIGVWLNQASQAGGSITVS